MTCEECRRYKKECGGSDGIVCDDYNESTLYLKVMEVVGEHYGVALNETFNISEYDSCMVFKFTEHGLLENDNSFNDEFESSDYEVLEDLIEELVKIKEGKL